MPRMTIAQENALRAELESLASKVAKLQQQCSEYAKERAALQDKLATAHAELENAAMTIAKLGEEGPPQPIDEQQRQILEKLNALTTAFSVHMNANTTALNVMNAQIANLKVGK